jgi:hypothetical protein
MDTIFCLDTVPSTNTGQFDTKVPPEGLRMAPAFCPENVRDPFDSVEWETQTATRRNAEVLYHDMTWLIPRQYGSSNLLSRFNVGLHQQYEITSKKRIRQWNKKADAHYSLNPLTFIIMDTKFDLGTVSSVNIDLFDGAITIKSHRKAPAPSPDSITTAKRRLRGVAKELRQCDAAEVANLPNLQQVFLFLWDKICEDSGGTVRSMLHQLERNTVASDTCSAHPCLTQASVGQGTDPIIIDERFTKPIEMLMNKPDEELDTTKKPLPVRDDDAIRAIQENTVAVKENTAARENAVFNAAFRSQARFRSPDDEVDIEKIIRLKHDGWKWENIVLTVYPDSGSMSKGDFNKLVDATKKMYQRESELAESRNPGEGWASMR